MQAHDLYTWKSTRPVKRLAGIQEEGRTLPALDETRSAPVEQVSGRVVHDAGVRASRRDHGHRVRFPGRAPQSG